MANELHSLEYLCDEYLKNNYIDPETSERLGVRRGLRNPDGTGVLAGLTNVCDVVGYDMINGVRTPRDGQLIYRGIDVEDIVRAAYTEDRFIFEEVTWLLLFGILGIALLRCAMIAFVEVSSFGIGTSTMYLATVHPLFSLYAFVSVAAFGAPKKRKENAA